ncbi:hypothetical protein AB0M11_38945 [Streptomyces sp. NPDC051987]|uniref:hypothetical protein n=1 Tax=Streptomyces sp. NPDC051987 TaxID=3155808 RepID=UPI003444061D
MSDKVHVGDNFKITGDNAIGKIENNSQSGSELQDLIRAARYLRDHVSTAERQAIDDSLDEIGQSGLGPSTLSRLRRIAIAAGEVGVPLLTSVSLAMQMLGR